MESIFLNSIAMSLKTVVDGPQPGLKCPIPVSGGVLTEVKSEVDVQVPSGPVEVQTGRPIFKPPKGIGEFKLLSILTECLEFFHDMNTSVKISYSYV